MKSNSLENSPENGVKTPESDNRSKKETKRFCNGILTFCNAVVFEHKDEMNGKYLIAPFGDWKNGEYIQRIDNVAGENLKRNMSRVWTRIKNSFGNACPVFYEHPDGEDAKELPDVADKTPYGKVRSLEILSNGIYANIDWLAGFSELPKRLQISPRWNADFIADNIARPSRLVSLGLTRNPVIKDTSFVNSTQQQKEPYMDKEILKLLGYSDEECQKIIDKAADAPADVADRIKKALADKATLENDCAAAKKDAEAKGKELGETKTALANSQVELKHSQAHRAALIVANAVRSGKILEAQRESAVKILANSEDFEAEAKKLDEQKPAIKTAAESGGIEKTEKERLFDQQKAQAEIAKFVAEKESQGMEYAAAWDAVKSEKSDLFKTAYPAE